MSYSRKKETRNCLWLCGSITKAAIVLAAAVCFCSGGGFQNNSDAAAEPATVELPEIRTAVTDNDLPPETTQSVDAETDDDSFIKPTDGILTSGFGERWGKRHTGIDIGAENGDNILAANDGIITFAGVLGGYGNYIVIDHGNGFETAYGHCSELLMSEGETVEKGMLIAYVGSTGNSTGPHLHFEVKADGEFLNPLDYVMY